jgi:hypothetical protein
MLKARCTGEDQSADLGARFEEQLLKSRAGGRMVAFTDIPRIHASYRIHGM